MEKYSKRDTAIARSMLRKLIYFDIFSHPLLPTEIIDYCNYPGLKTIDGLRILHHLEEKRWVNVCNGFYFLGDDTSKVDSRIEANQLANKRMKAAKRYARIISNFPYVRAVLISGSLSKHVMKPDSDIDFFIITKVGRLWACRAFLTFFKKVFLGDSYRNFCLNYFIDTESLEIPDKNVFTATEIAFILPMYNYPLYRKFMAANHWCRGEYPNFKERPEIVRIKPFFLKKVLEYVFNKGIGDWLDDKSFSIITGYWKNKFKYLDKKDFEFNFRSKKNVSKHHPNSFQHRVVLQYQTGIAAFESQTGFNLNQPQRKVTYEY